jgi:hypothetical protein
MLRNKPRVSYSGLTVVLSNPSRFDKVSLLSANGGVMFNNWCLQPDINVMQCDVRLADDNSPWLDGTKCILLLGEYAMHKYCDVGRNTVASNTLNEMRGSVLHIGDIPAIASFYPQDAVDIKSWEQQLNEDSKEYQDADEGASDEDDEGDVKRFSITKRSNFSFWLKRDVWKCKQILKHGSAAYHNSNPPIYRIYPSADEVISALKGTVGQWIYFDMETDYEEQNMLCFSFSFDGHTIYCVPVLDNDYHWAYSSLHHIMGALALAISRNTIVAHNGAAFDFFVLAHKYKIAIGKSYDTMMAMHRCFPDIEKSLGHCTSYWTWETFHKDSDSRAYFTREHMMQKLTYCGKDVYTMYLVHKEIEKYAKTIPGLPESITCAMDSIRPYLIATLQGVRYSQEKVTALQQTDIRLLEQYMRCIRLLIGDESMQEIRTKALKGKAKAFPPSNKQCCYYFHEMLGYPVMQRGKPHHKTGERFPSLAKKAMFKLALKYPDNPVITFINLWRQTQEELKKLTFVPWKDNNNETYREPKDTITQDTLFR